MDVFITVTISLVLILGATLTINQRGYTFDLRRKPGRIAGGRRHDDREPVRAQ
jgi:hypothetical protein